MSLLKELENVKTITSSHGRQHIFMPGSKSIMCDEFFAGINCIQGNYGAYFQPTDDDHTRYVWGQSVECTIQNHSALPIYVTIRMVRPKMNVKANTTETVDVFSAYPIRKEVSSTIMAAYFGLLEEGIDSAKLYAIDQGVVGGKAAGDVALSFGEGTGAIPASTTVPAPLSLNSTYAHTGFAYPLGVSPFNNVYFNMLYKHSVHAKIALAPGQSYTFHYNDKDLKAIQSVTDVGGSDRFQSLNVFDSNYYVFNKYQVTPVFEIEGSLWGQDPMVGSASYAAQVSWAPTTASITDNIDFAPWDNANPDPPGRGIVDEVSTHGGVVRFLYKKRLRYGEYTNEIQDVVTNLGDNYNIEVVGRPDDPIGRYRQLNVHS